MNASYDDVKDMVAALFTLIGGLEKARKHIPNASALNTLQIIAMHGEIRPSEIAALLDVHQSSVTRQIQVLQDKGYVNIVIDPEDRRSCIITLSDSGLAEMARLTEMGLQRFATFVADWQAEEVRTFTRLLIKLEESKAEIGRQESVDASDMPHRRHWHNGRT
jgi:DNA-binding MarR family transcriptional regulator